MKPLDGKLLKKLLKAAGSHLRGDWVLIGGTVLPALGIDIRATTDIDLIELNPKEAPQTLALMELAEGLGLPVETINQAGAYFLSKIPKSHQHLVLLHSGSQAKIYRPDVTFFIRLKIARLTETDLSDCIAFLKLAKRLGEKLRQSEIGSIIQSELKKDPPPDRRRRLELLQDQLRTAR